MTDILHAFSLKFLYQHVWWLGSLYTTATRSVLPRCLDTQYLSFFDSVNILCPLHVDFAVKRVDVQLTCLDRKVGVNSQVIHGSSGGSRISPRRGRRLRGAPTYDFAIFSQKLHEIERIWDGGACVPRTPLRSATRKIIQWSDFWKCTHS